jgi:hypothetical protein
MIQRYDAWALRRLLTGDPVYGELQVVSEPFRPLAVRLASLPMEARQTALDGFLAAREDRDKIIMALADGDPSGSAPEPGTADGPAAPRRRFKMTRAADLICRPVDWLWRHRVPRGTLTLFAGDPKVGKSLVTIAMAAAVSRGVALPGDDPPDGPGSVVMLSAEDDPARAIVPRLKAAGANLNRVHILEAVYFLDGTEALPNLRADIDAIEQAVAGLGDCRLIVIDPVSAYLAGIDDHRNSELRGVLSPLKIVAERTNAAVVLVTHLNKGAGTNGKHRVIGSIAYVGTCRASFLFVRDRKDPTGRRVLMLDNGCNLVASVATLAYRIDDHGDGSVVEWETEPVNVTAEQALAAESNDPYERDERAECDEWLAETLDDGPKPAAEIYKAGRDAGFTKDDLKRSKRRIGATTNREGFGRGSKCHWSLPSKASTHELADP